MALPQRTLDTMSDAIAMSSPNGRMSKRAHREASVRLAKALFGDSDLKGEGPQQSDRERLLQHAARLRDLAARGMSARKFLREAAKAEAQAEALA